MYIATRRIRSASQTPCCMLVTSTEGLDSLRGRETLKHSIVFVGLAIVVLSMASACGGAEPTAAPTTQPTIEAPPVATSVPSATPQQEVTEVPTSEPTATPQQEATEKAPTATAAAPQVPQQVATGMNEYDQSCARCHGPNLTDGFAAKLSTDALAKYETAQGLFDYVSARMPRDNPGGLSGQQYYDILSYLLFTQQLLEPGQVVDESTVADILLSQ